MRDVADILRLETRRCAMMRKRWWGCSTGQKTDRPCTLQSQSLCGFTPSVWAVYRRLEVVLSKRVSVKICFKRRWTALINLLICYFFISELMEPRLQCTGFCNFSYINWLLVHGISKLVGLVMFEWWNSKVVRTRWCGPRSLVGEGRGKAPPHKNREKCSLELLTTQRPKCCDNFCLFLRCVLL